MLRTHSRLFRALKALGVTAAAALVAACGGGGDGGGGSSGGGGAQPAANQAVVTVAQGVEGVVNIPTVSVKVCAPGTNTCQTIDNIQVDTESFGLRIASAAANQVLGALPKQTIGGSQLAECTAFADGHTWGSIRTADLTIGSKTASAVPIQIVGDMPQGAVLTGGCSTGALELTPADLGANGILGLGVAPYDCGSLCASAPVGNSNYYACPNGANCAQTLVPVAQQVTNPIIKFASDNNGVILAMPSIGPSGQRTVTGMLTFGINTQANNGLPASATKLATNAFGDVNATYNGTAVVAFFDSGSNAYFLTDSSLPACTGNASAFYCPPSTVTRGINVANYNLASPGASGGAALSMSIGNASQLLANGNFALNDIAGDLGTTSFVDLGMPFFYGRTVYYGMDQSGSGGAAPFVAF